MANFTWFPTFPIFCHQGVLFLEKSQKFSFRWGVHRQFFFEFSNFFKSFATNAAGNDPQWKIWPKTWLRLGQNSHFCIFFYLFPPKWGWDYSEWSISPDSQLFPSFANKASHFWRNPKNFHFWGGGVHRQIFWVFQLFQIVWHQCGWKWPTMANLAKKWLRLGQNGHFCIFFYLFPQMRLRLTRNGQFHLTHNFSHLLPPSISFLEKSQKFSFLGRVHQQIFWVLQLFQIVWHQCGWKWPTMANLAKKVA